MTKPASWCYTCGAKLKVSPYVYAYNDETGTEKVSFLYRCPTDDARRWWQRWRSHPKTEGEAYALEAGSLGL